MRRQLLKIPRRRACLLEWLMERRLKVYEEENDASELSTPLWTYLGYSQFHRRCKAHGAGKPVVVQRLNLRSSSSRADPVFAINRQHSGIAVLDTEHQYRRPRSLPTIPRSIGISISAHPGFSNRDLVPGLANDPDTSAGIRYIKLKHIKPTRRSGSSRLPTNVQEHHTSATHGNVLTVDKYIAVQYISTH